MRHVPCPSFDDAVPLPRLQAARPPSRLARVAAALAGLAGLPARVAAARRDMALLGRMDARELADVGLVRQDIADAASLRLGRSPTRLLVHRAAERRRAARAGWG